MKEPVVKQINLKKEIHDLHHRMETNLARRNKLLNSKNAKEPHIIRLGSKRKKMKT